MSDVKVQINTLQALEKMIGNDSKMELEIRQGIADAFSKKFLKGLVEERLQTAVKQNIELVLTEANYLQKNGYYTVITPQFKTQIAGQIVEVINENVKLQVQVVVQTYEAKLKTAFEDAYKKIEMQLSETVLTNKLEELVNQRIKVRLGL